MKRPLIISLVVAVFFITCNSPSFGQEDQLTRGVQNASVGTELNNRAPEISSKNSTGMQVELSSMRGKLVLIDFWASWCRPCRVNNAELVALYNLYKEKRFVNGKGFAVLSVSLDSDAAEWQNAIAKDDLKWQSHVSDLKGADSEFAKLYGIRAIPANVLIDGNGIIIAKNLRGQALRDALEKYSSDF